MPCNGPYHSFRINSINSSPIRPSRFRCHECNGGFPSRQALLDHQNAPEKRTPNRSDPQRYPRRHAQPPIMPKQEDDAPSNPSEKGVALTTAASSSSKYSPYQRSRAVKLEPFVKIDPKKEVLSGNSSPERSMAVKLEPDVKIEPKEEVVSPGENNNGDETDSENETD